jgi:hypothetical protein
LEGSGSLSSIVSTDHDCINKQPKRQKVSRIAHATETYSQHLVKDGTDGTLQQKQKEGLQEEQDKVRLAMHVMIPDGHVDTNSVT